ncbi:MAG: pyridoxamine 5'-phosphate oxidase family protein [Planctomycetota bacterium]
MSFDTDSLPDLLDHLWHHLDVATRSAKPPFHLPTLGTVDAEGHPATRTVVLRGIHRDTRQVICHTDARAGKVGHLAERPVSSWVFYDAPAKVQLRVAGPTTVHTDDGLADRQWSSSRPSSRRCYLAPRPPGSACDGPSPNLPASVVGRVPDEEESEAGRANFAVVCCVATRFDFLYLHHAGHRRAVFTWDGGPGAEPAMTWAEP